MSEMTVNCRGCAAVLLAPDDAIGVQCPTCNVVTPTSMVTSRTSRNFDDSRTGLLSNDYLSSGATGFPAELPAGEFFPPDPAFDANGSPNMYQGGKQIDCCRASGCGAMVFVLIILVFFVSAAAIIPSALPNASDFVKECVRGERSLRDSLTVPIVAPVGVALGVAGLVGAFFVFALSKTSDPNTPHAWLHLCMVSVIFTPVLWAIFVHWAYIFFVMILFPYGLITGCFNRKYTDPYSALLIRESILVLLRPQNRAFLAVWIFGFLLSSIVTVGIFVLLTIAHFGNLVAAVFLDIFSVFAYWVLQAAIGYFIMTVSARMIATHYYTHGVPMAGEAGRRNTTGAAFVAALSRIPLIASVGFSVPWVRMIGGAGMLFIVMASGGAIPVLVFALPFAACFWCTPHTLVDATVMHVMRPAIYKENLDSALESVERSLPEDSDAYALYADQHYDFIQMRVAFIAGAVASAISTVVAYIYWGDCGDALLLAGFHGFFGGMGGAWAIVAPACGGAQILQLCYAEYPAPMSRVFPALKPAFEAGLAGARDSIKLHDKHKVADLYCAGDRRKKKKAEQATAEGQDLQIGSPAPKPDASRDPMASDTAYSAL